MKSCIKHERTIKRQKGTLLKLNDRSHIVGFDEGTVVTCRTGELGTAIRDIIIARAIGGSCELLEKLKVRKGARVNG